MPHAAASIGSDYQVYKRFDIRAEHPLQLELRLDVFSQAIQARGGRVLGVCRYHKPESGHSASVQYSLPLPGRARAKWPTPLQQQAAHAFESAEMGA